MSTAIDHLLEAVYLLERREVDVEGATAHLRAGLAILGGAMTPMDGENYPPITGRV